MEKTAFPVLHFNRFWERPVFLVILLVAATLRLWGLDQNGFGNPYYAAAVRSMLTGWHNFFFVSFDPAGYVTVDKPPVSLWIQTLFTKIFGYRGFTLILPQVLEGLGSVAVLYHLVHRRFGAVAASIAGLALSLTPISVAVDRYNNTDACLVFVLLLSAWALGLAAEKGSQTFLLLAMALVGVGFNTKMMAAFILLPALYAVYFFGAPAGSWKKLKDLGLATLVVFTVALSWPLAVDLTPADQRPFVGSTQDNSMISLSLGWNGFQRLLSRGRHGFPQRPEDTAAVPGAVGQNVPDPSNPSAPSWSQAPSPENSPDSPGEGRRGMGGRMGSGNPGPLRLADKNMAGQVTWFLPLCLIGLFAAWKRSGKLLPLSPAHQTLALWAGWFASYALVLSFMRGAMHPYYLVLLAPPLAALTGIGLNALGQDLWAGKKNLLFAALFFTAAWQSFIVARYPDWSGLLLPILLTGVGLSLAGLVLVPYLKIERSRWTSLALGTGILSLALCPAVWALTPVLVADPSVEAGPDLLSGGRGMGFGGGATQTSIEKLVDFLRAHHRQEAYLLVAQNSQVVAPIIIRTGEPVVALGGFMGADPTLTLDQFIQDVKNGKFRYMLLGDFNRDRNQRGNLNGNGRGFGGGPGFGNRTGPQADIAKWVKGHAKAVDPSLWRPAIPPDEAADRIMDGRNGAAGAPDDFPMALGGRRGALAALTLYDLEPSVDVDQLK